MLLVFIHISLFIGVFSKARPSFSHVLSMLFLGDVIFVYAVVKFCSALN